MKIRLLSLAAACAAMPVMALAADGTASFGISTLGADISASTRLSPQFGLRGIAGQASLSRRD